MRKYICCLLITLCSTSLWAQQDSLRPRQLEGVEVIESRARRNLTSPVPLHAFSSSDMLRLGVTGITDALGRMPGVTVRDYGGAGGMKTVSVRGYSAKYTGVVYDGLALSDCQTGETDLSRYSLHSVDYIGMTVGDGADIFQPARQSAYPALLTIKTQPNAPADYRSRLACQVEWGSFGFVSPYVRYAKRLSSKADISALAEYTYSENDYPFTITNGTEVIHKRRTNSRMNSGHGEVNLRLAPSQYSLLTLKAYYYDNDRLLPGIVKYYTDISGESLRDRNFFAQAIGTVTNRRGDLSLKVSGRFNWVASIYKDKVYSGGVNDASYWQRESYATASLLYEPSRNWSFDVSADYAFNNLNSSLATDTRPYRHSLWQSATAKFATARLTMLARVLGTEIFNNARQREKARDMSRLSPSLSLSYRLLEGKDIYVRASYKNIFRAPNFNESYYYHYGSTTLDPESTDQLNLGFTLGAHTPTLSGQVQIDTYYNNIKDMIVAVPYNMFVWTCVNVGRVRSLGAELTATGNAVVGRGQSLTFQGSYSFQRVSDRTDESSASYGLQIAYIPQHSGSLSIGWENPWVNLSLHGYGVSSRWPNNSHYDGTLVAGYWDTGATLWKRFRLLGCRWEARFDMKNIFDKQYSIVSHYPMPGRCWTASLKCEM